MREKFSKLLKNDPSKERGFGSALFNAIDPILNSWKEEMAPSLSATPQIDKTEKGRVLDSLKAYVEEARDHTKESQVIPLEKGEIHLKTQDKIESNTRVFFVTDEGTTEGEATLLLKKMASAMTLSLNDYAICESKDLEKLNDEITKERPLFVFTLGAKATAALLGVNERLAVIHGQYFERTRDNHTFTVVPLFHPEYLLVNPAMKKIAWADMQKVMKSLGLLN